MTNGDHAQRRQERAKELARSSKRTRRMRAPLRKITDRHLVDGRLIEILECGHSHEPRPALYGAGTGPARRRCVPCLEAMEAAVGNGDS